VKRHAPYAFGSSGLDTGAETVVSGATGSGIRSWLEGRRAREAKNPAANAETRAPRTMRIIKAGIAAMAHLTMNTTIEPKLI
jgi:hypothetical protein